MHCCLKDENFAARLKKMLTSFYLRTGVRKKDFLHSGSIGLTVGQARAHSKERVASFCLMVSERTGSSDFR